MQEPLRSASSAINRVCLLARARHGWWVRSLLSSARSPAERTKMIPNGCAKWHAQKNRRRSGHWAAPARRTTSGSCLAPDPRTKPGGKAPPPPHRVPRYARRSGSSPTGIRGFESPDPLDANCCQRGHRRSFVQVRRSVESASSLVAAKATPDLIQAFSVAVHPKAPCLRQLARGLAFLPDEDAYWLASLGRMPSVKSGRAGAGRAVPGPTD